MHGAALLRRNIRISGRATMPAPPQDLHLISFARYRALLASREIGSSFAASLLGRLPIGMSGLAILLLVQASSGSFARGGAATGCYVAGLAGVAPVAGRLIDRFGPRLLLFACAMLFPTALSAMVWSVNQGSAAWITLSFAAIAGAAFPPITVCMRTYLKRALARDEPLLAAAYSLESVLIELMFIAGPMLVAAFVAWASPQFAVLFSAGCAFVGTLLFLRSPALLNWHVERQLPKTLLGPLSEPQFLRLIGVILCYSCAFGLLEIGITAHATEQGQPATAGVLLGLMSLGSACGGLFYGSRNWGAPLERQFAATLAIMGFGLGALTLGWHPVLFAALCVLAGIVMAPALTIQSMLVAKTSAPEHYTEAFTWSASSLLAGIGVGFAVGGGLLEIASSKAVLATAAGSALLAAAGALSALPVPKPL